MYLRGSKNTSLTATEQRGQMSSDLRVGGYFLARQHPPPPSATVLLGESEVDARRWHVVDEFDDLLHRSVYEIDSTTYATATATAYTTTNNNSTTTTAAAYATATYATATYASAACYLCCCYYYYYCCSYYYYYCYY